MYISGFGYYALYHTGRVYASLFCKNRISYKTMEKIKELFAIRPSESVHMPHKAVISGRGSIEKPHFLPLVGWMNSKAVQQSACSVSPDGQPSFLPYNVSPASG